MERYNMPNAVTILGTIALAIIMLHLNIHNWLIYVCIAIAYIMAICTWLAIDSKESERRNRHAYDESEANVRKIHAERRKIETETEHIKWKMKG